uniref:Uncharacterized protein n=1 Tax=Anguilla anguilla TaxID=7936 RepID=A0A0E9TUT8_ANGAN
MITKHLVGIKMCFANFIRTYSTSCCAYKNEQKRS